MNTKKKNDFIYTNKFQKLRKHVEVEFVDIAIRPNLDTKQESYYY